MKVKRLNAFNNLFRVLESSETHYYLQFCSMVAQSESEEGKNLAL